MLLSPQMQCIQCKRGQEKYLYGLHTTPSNTKENISGQGGILDCKRIKKKLETVGVRVTVFLPVAGH